MLFCRPVETTTRAEDVFKVVAAYFGDKDMKREKLVGICTDGAPAMLGSKSEFIARIKQNSPSAVGTHCLIHREGLASNTPSAPMNCKLAIAARDVNFVKASVVNSVLYEKLCKEIDSTHENLVFHTSICWLSKGNMLARVMT